MKVGCNTVAFRKYDLDFALDRIARAGYRHVEVEGNLSWCNHVDPWKDDPERFKAKVRSRGFADCSCIGSHRELIAEASAVDDIRRALEFAAAAGVPVVATGEGRLPDGMSEAEALETLRPKLLELARVAEANQVCLCMEHHGSISLGTGGMERILSLAPSEWIGVNFDTANPRRGDYVGTTRQGFEWKLDEAGRGDELAALRPVAGKVRHVHFKDVVGRNAVTLGSGEVRLKEIVDILRDAGYAGVLSYETEGWEEAESAQGMIEASLAWANGLLDQLGVKR